MYSYYILFLGAIFRSKNALKVTPDMFASLIFLLLPTFLHLATLPSVSGELCKQCDILGFVADFRCPKDGYPSTHTYCCGHNDTGLCCATPYPNYAEYSRNNTATCGEDRRNELVMILTYLGVMAAIFFCCCGLPLLCCCYFMPCCPWKRSRKRNQEQSQPQRQLREEEIPMKPVAEPAGYPEHNIGQPAVYPQPAYNPNAYPAQPSYFPASVPQGYPPQAVYPYPPQGYPDQPYPTQPQPAFNPTKPY